MKFIRTCCIIGGFPADVDLSSWQLVPNSTKGRRRWPGLVYFGSFVLHTLYKIATLLVTYFTRTDTPLHQLIIHAILALATPIVIFWYYQMYFNHAGAFSSFFQMTLTGNIGGVTTDGRPNGNLTTSTLQDLIAINLPYMNVPVFIAVIGMYIYDPTLPLLLYSGLPEQFQTYLSFTVILLEEMRFVLTLMAVTLPMWILQVISFDLVNNQLRTLISSIESIAKRGKLRTSYKSLRHIQLYVTIINVVNRHLIFSWKCVSIALSIFMGFAAIAQFGDYPIFGVMYFLVLTDGAFIYTVVYDKAFRIPGLFNQVARHAILKLGQGGCGDSGILKRQMCSIPRVLGIKVGEFHVLERESTPRFLHYILNNIVSMLVAYKY